MPLRENGRLLELFDVRPLAKNARYGLSAPIHLVFLMLLLLIGIGGWTAHRHTRRLYEYETQVSQTYRLLAQLQSILAAAVDAETGVRGYIATGQDSYLEPYRAAVDAFEPRLADLTLFATADHPTARTVEKLVTRGRAYFAHLERVLSIALQGDRDTAIHSLRAGDGKSLMDGIRDLIQQATISEQALLRDRQELARGSYRVSELMGLMVAVAGVFLIIVLYNMILRLGRLRTRATRVIEDARERFEVALGSIGDAVIVTDPEGRLAYCNDGCKSTLQLTDEDIGRPLEQLNCSIAEGPASIYQSLVLRAMREPGVHRTTLDTEIRLSNGARILVDATAARIRGDGDQSQGVVLVVRDVTERRERERELARVHERFRSLALATSQIAWTMDKDGRAREDSPSWRAYTGHTYEQWRGLGWLDAIHPDDRERTLYEWQDAVQGQLPFATEYRLRRVDGSYCWNLVRALPVKDADGTVREWVGMNHDVEEIKRAERARRDASRRKDEFIALLAHELRNPLAPLRNALALLKAGGPADAPRAIGMMERQVAHIVRLIDDLLDVSRISQGKFELRKENLDLRDVLLETVESVGPAAWAKQQELQIDLPQTPLWVHGDPVRLLQVFTNLLNNAIKYSGPSAGIWVTAEREGPHLLVSVRDAGQGIAAELVPRIWDMFLQGGGASERSEGGLGIGLTLVKRLVEMHDGSVHVESPGVGQGSEFTVRLPGVGAAAPSALPARRIPPSPARSLKILVIDDNEDSVESSAMLLRVGGHSVRTATSGQAGLTEFEHFAPELVLCDIRMPDLTGYEVARQLRPMRAVRSFLLVAMTGFGSKADREASLQAGFDRHYVKPIDPADLSALIRETAELLTRSPHGGTL